MALPFILLGLLICRPAPVTALLELFSSAVALLAAIGSEGQMESHLELLTETCQAQVKRAQLAWQRLSLGTRLTAVAVIRVAGPTMFFLFVAFLQALRRPGHDQACQGEGQGEESAC